MKILIIGGGMGGTILANNLARRLGPELKSRHHQPGQRGEPVEAHHRRQQPAPRRQQRPHERHRLVVAGDRQPALRVAGRGEHLLGTPLPHGVALPQGPPALTPGSPGADEEARGRGRVPADRGARDGGRR